MRSAMNVWINCLIFICSHFGTKKHILCLHFRSQELLEKLHLFVISFCNSCRPDQIQYDKKTYAKTRNVSENKAQSPQWKQQ